MQHNKLELKKRGLAPDVEGPIEDVPPMTMADREQGSPRIPRKQSYRRSPKTVPETEPSTADLMPKLYERLRAIGYSTAFVREVALPNWWVDEAAKNLAGYAEALLVLSRHLGLDYASLQAADEPLRFRDFGECKFKTLGGEVDDRIRLARAFAQRTAQLASATFEQKAALIPSASEIRQAILGEEAPWVGLPRLLEYCWTSGVPVLHLSGFPKRAKRPAGFATLVHGRPAVVLCDATRSPARLLHLLAHELGHLALGHVPPDGALFDEQVDLAENADAEERAANAFAAELLTGRTDARLFHGGRVDGAAGLVETAQEWGKQFQVDPAYAVLIYSRDVGPHYFPVAKAALRRLEAERDGAGDVLDAMAAHLDLAALPEASAEFLLRVTNREPTA